MCVQSVSLWAEATWYRLGGGARPGDDVTGPATVEPVPSAAQVAADDGAGTDARSGAEKVLVSR